MSSLSVVIPCYNGMPYIKKCLASIVEQELHYLDCVEVIVVDDLSTDDSCEFVRSFSLEAPTVNPKVSVSLLERPFNSGSGTLPRNDGIEAATKDYIFLMDADDWFSPGALDKMVQHADEWNSDILLCKPVGENGRNVVTSVFKKSVPNCDIYTSYVVRKLGNTNLYRAKFLKDNNILGTYAKKSPSDDWDFAFKAYLQAKVISVAADCAYYHVLQRGDNGNLTQKLIDTTYTSSEWFNFWNQLFENFERYADKTRLHIAILPKLANSVDMPFRTLKDLILSEDPTQFFCVLDLWNKWFDFTLLEGRLNVDSKIVLFAAQTKNLAVLENAYQIVKHYKEENAFSSDCVEASEEGILIKLIDENGKTFSCDVTQEIVFPIENIKLSYEEATGSASNYLIDIKDYGDYLSLIARASLVLLNDKTEEKLAFPLTLQETGRKTSRFSVIFDTTSLIAQFEPPKAKWNIYLELNAPSSPKRLIRLRLKESNAVLFSQKSQGFYFYGITSQLGYVSLKQETKLPVRFKNTRIIFNPENSILSCSGDIVSSFDIPEASVISVLFISELKQRIEFEAERVINSIQKIEWSVDINLEKLLKRMVSNVRWDLYAAIKPEEEDEVRVRLGSQLHSEELVNAINESHISSGQSTRNESVLYAYLSPPRNIHVKKRTFNKYANFLTKIKKRLK